MKSVVFIGHHIFAQVDSVRGGENTGETKEQETRRTMKARKAWKSENAIQ